MSFLGESVSWSFCKFSPDLKISEIPIPLQPQTRALGGRSRAQRVARAAVAHSRATHARALSPSRLRAPPPRGPNPIKSAATRVPAVGLGLALLRGPRGPAPSAEHRAPEPWPRSCTTRSSPGRASRRDCRSGGSRSWSWCRCPRGLTATSTSGMPTWCCTPPRRAGASFTDCTSGSVRGGRPLDPDAPRSGSGEAERGWELRAARGSGERRGCKLGGPAAPPRRCDPTGAARFGLAIFSRRVRFCKRGCKQRRPQVGSGLNPVALTFVTSISSALGLARLASPLFNSRPQVPLAPWAAAPRSAHRAWPSPAHLPTSSVLVSLSWWLSQTSLWAFAAAGKKYLFFF